MYGRDYYGDRGYGNRGWNTRDYDMDYTYGGYAGGTASRGYGANRGTATDYGSSYGEPRYRNNFRGYNSSAGVNSYNSAGYGGYDRDFGYNDRVTFRAGGDRMRGGYSDGRDMGDRLREGWHDLKRGVRRTVGGGYDRG